MKKPLNQEMLNKFLAYLNEIRVTEGTEMSLTQLCKKHKLTNHASTMVLKLNLATKQSHKNYKASFDHFEPIHAKQLYEGCKSYASRLAKNKKLNDIKLAVKNSSPIKEQSENNQRTIRVPVPRIQKPSSNGHSADKPLRKISILWGLYTKTY